jgi:hypothetical protein
MPGWGNGPASGDRAGPPGNWGKVKQRFLAAVAPCQRPSVAAVLDNWHAGGKGLRQWLRGLVRDEQCVPKSIPPELIRVYLDDPDAAPLYGCSRCGLALPGLRSSGWETEAEFKEAYFEHCPSCGHSIGLYAHWSARKIEVDCGACA